MADITVKYKGLTGAQGEIVIDNGETLDDLIADIAADEGISSTDYYRISLNRDYAINDVLEGDSSNTLLSLGVVSGDEFLCTVNQYGTKQERQKQKLDIAAAKRNENYDITKLPTQYSGNAIVDNANTGGLELRRPWVLDYRIVTRNLQLYLDAADTDGYPGTGTTWTDLSDNEYATTLVDAPTFNTTHFTFDGSADYVDTNQSLASESFSVGAWFRTSATGINMMLSKEVAAGRPWNYRLWLNSGVLTADIAQATPTDELTHNGGYNDGEWYLAMFTRDSNNWFLYVNGQQVNTRSDSFTGTISNSQELWIGRSAFTSGGANPSGSYPYEGDIGQVFIYDAVLTPAEILQNYNATRATYGL